MSFILDALKKSENERQQQAERDQHDAPRLGDGRLCDQELARFERHV